MPQRDHDLRASLMSPRHTRARTVLRTLGPIILLLGVVLVALAVFEVVAGDPFGPGSRAWMAFAGMPLIFIGAVMCMFGFIGTVARYHAGEYAPVAKDTVNYLAEGTKDSVKTISQALGAGLREGLTEPEDGTTTCASCEATNEAGSRFCDQCGEALKTERACAACEKVNDADARFCDGCGRSLDETKPR